MFKTGKIINTKMLKETFIELSSKYTDNKSLKNELWAEIEQNYSHKNRHYHTLLHIEDVIHQLNEVKEKIENWDALLFAVFYHDIVYNVLNSDNEEQSAELAGNRMKQINVPGQIIDTCKAHILATKKHSDKANPDINYFMDADLAILGQDVESYKEYGRNIRLEFSHYPTIIYNNGRIKILTHFLALTPIYKTEHFYKKFEKQARFNISEEIAT